VGIGGFGGGGTIYTSPGLDLRTNKVDSLEKWVGDVGARNRGEIKMGGEGRCKTGGVKTIGGGQPEVLSV